MLVLNLYVDLIYNRTSMARIYWDHGNLFEIWVVRATFGESDRLSPVTILAASCCNFSRVFVSCCVQSSQTKDEFICVLVFEVHMRYISGLRLFC